MRRIAYFVLLCAWAYQLQAQQKTATRTPQSNAQRAPQIVQQVDPPKGKLLLVTDEDCVWTLDRDTSAELKAGDGVLLAVTEGKHLIEAVTPDKLASYRDEKVEAEQTQTLVGIRLKRQRDAKLDVARNPTWTDLKAGLMWMRQSSEQKLTLAGADVYCRELAAGGFNNWRIPTRDELDHLLMMEAMAVKNSTVALADSGIGVLVESSGPEFNEGIRATGPVWIVKPFASNNIGDLSNGSYTYSNGSAPDARVLCVRSTKN